MREYNLGLRFEGVVRRHGDRPALWFRPDETVTYEQLDEAANHLAQQFLAAGLKRGDVIAISGEKHLATFAAILACLKIGAPYAPLDPAGPVERQTLILQTCQPSLLVGTAADLARLGTASPDTAQFELDADSDVLLSAAAAARGSGDPPAAMRSVTGSTIAYIMFTSGSTGVPKGAAITHDNVRNFIDWAQATYSITQTDVLTNVNALYFDNSVFDIYAAFFSGATLVPFAHDTVRDAKALVERVDAAGCTIWFSVPSLLIFLQAMRATDGRQLRSLRSFIFGGEGYPKAKLAELYRVYSGSATFHNVYGPTECTCICSSYELGAADFEDLAGIPTLGEIAPNFSYLILQPDGAPAAVGEVGELCLLGPGVGAGYFNDPERTSAAFVQNPLNTSYRELVYRTGDMVRVAGEPPLIWFCGRADNQVKHMGYRIELDEVESALNTLSYVTEAAALHGRIGGQPRIVAVLATDREVDAAALRRELRDKLPDYMIPSVVIREQLLPKNANGKIDRLALRATYLDPPSAKAT